MKYAIYILLMFTMLSGAVLGTSTDLNTAADTVTSEHQIKVAFLYNFFSFIDWPEDKMGAPDRPIVIGIVKTEGSEEFVKALDLLTKKQVKDRKIILKTLDDTRLLSGSENGNSAAQDELIESLKECHVVLFCESSKMRIDNLPLIIKTLKGSPVLTVAERPGFIENGGQINFLTVDNKMRFEINQTAAKENRLSIRAKLLKLAVRVITEE